jgi:hypothetical protein
MAGSLCSMFDFAHPDPAPLILDETTAKVLEE